MPRQTVIGDWGNSRLRLWRLADGVVTGRRDGPGVGATSDPAGALAEILADWTPGRIVLCGMAGARNGLHEVAYVPCPASPEDWAGGAVQTEFAGVPLRIAAGLAFRDPADRPEVMRGEEAQLFGAIARDPSLGAGRHLVLLPGTHSKWIDVQDGRIAGFRTFITGELFALLEKSSLFAARAAADGGEQAGFAAGMDRASEGCALSSDLFEARSRQLCDGKSSDWARGFVSGLLIGAEIGQMKPSGPVLVIGERSLAQRYCSALELRGIDARTSDGEECAVAGLRMLE